MKERAIYGFDPDELNGKDLRGLAYRDHQTDTNNEQLNEQIERLTD